MRRVFGSMRLRSALLTAAALAACGVSSAAELQIQTLATFEDDLILAAVRAPGDVAILRAEAIDQVRAGSDPAPVARAAAGERLFLAAGGSYYGVSIHRAGAADFAPTQSFELRDAGGDRLWSIGPTEDVSYAISSRGSVVGLQLNVNIAAKNRLHFYGEDGALLADVSVPRLLGGSFDPEGRVFIATSGSEGALGFDASGRQLWMVRSGRLSAAAPGGRTVAVVGPGALTVVRDGVAGESVDLGDLLVRRVAISADGSRIAVAAKHEIRIYDAASLTEIRRIETGSASLAWTSIDIAPDGRRIAAGLARELGSAVPVERRHPDGEVRVYSIEGDLAHSASMTFTHWNIFTPTVLWKPSGDALTITTRRAVYETAVQ